MATTYALPFNGSASHSHSHSHSNRGHTRSHHRKAVPDRLSLAANSMNGAPQATLGNSQKVGPSTNANHTHSQSLPQSLLNEKHQTHHEHHRSTSRALFQATEHSNLTQSHMDHGRPRLLATLPRIQSGYGFPAAGEEGQSLVSASGPRTGYATDTPVVCPVILTTLRTPVVMLEVISSILIPLPLALISLLFSTQSLSPVTGSTMANSNGQDKDAVEKEMSSYSTLLVVCVVTSATLLVVGTLGKWQSRTDALDRRKRSHSSLGPRGEKSKTAKDIMTTETARRVAHRVLAIGLPFVSASMVGSLRTAAILLLAVAGDFSNAEGSTANVTKSGGLRRLLELRAWTLIVILLHIVTHLAGTITSAQTIWPSVVGYVCLGISAFIFPLPYSTPRVSASSITSPMPRSAEKTSAVSTPWEAPPAMIGPSDGERTRSPLVSTPKDTNLTLLAGVLTATLCAALFLFRYPTSTSISILQIGIVLLVSAVGAFSLTFAYPHILMTEKKLGLAIGFVVLILFQEMSDPQSWLLFVYQGVSLGLFWVALNIDTQSAASVPHFVVPHSRQPGPKTIKGAHSRFTALLLLSFGDWPLLHSIIVEKDSRRIFYFMW